MAFRLPLTSLNVNLSNLPVEDRRFPASQNLKLEDIPKQLDDNDCRFVTSDQQNHKEVHFPFSSREGAGIEQDGTGEVEYFPNMADVSSTEILFSFWEGPVRTFESAGHAFMLTPANKASVQEANADVELESPAELCGKGVGGLWQESEGGSPVPALSPATIELLCGLSLSGSCSGAPTHTSAAVALPPAVLEGLFSPGLDGGGGEGSATPGMTPGPLEPAPGGSGGRPSPFARLQRRFAFATPLTGWSEAASPSPPRQGGAQDGEPAAYGAVAGAGSLEAWLRGWPRELREAMPEPIRQDLAELWAAAAEARRRGSPERRGADWAEADSLGRGSGMPPSGRSLRNRQDAPAEGEAVEPARPTAPEQPLERRMRSLQQRLQALEDAAQRVLAVVPLRGPGPASLQGGADTRGQDGSGAAAGGAGSEAAAEGNGPAGEGCRAAGSGAGEGAGSPARAGCGPREPCHGDCAHRREASPVRLRSPATSQTDALGALRGAPPRGPRRQAPAESRPERQAAMGIGRGRRGDSGELRRRARALGLHLA